MKKSHIKCENVTLSLVASDASESDVSAFIEVHALTLNTLYNTFLIKTVE